MPINVIRNIINYEELKNNYLKSLKNPGKYYKEINYYKYKNGKIKIYFCFGLNGSSGQIKIMFKKFKRIFINGFTIYSPKANPKKSFDERYKNNYIQKNIIKDFKKIKYFDFIICSSFGFHELMLTGLNINNFTKKILWIAPISDNYNDIVPFWKQICAFFLGMSNKCLFLPVKENLYASEKNIYQKKDLEAIFTYNNNYYGVFHLNIMKERYKYNYKYKLNNLIIIFGNKDEYFKIKKITPDFIKNKFYKFSSNIKTIEFNCGHTWTIAKFIDNFEKLQNIFS